jgi:xylulokinase
MARDIVIGMDYGTNGVKALAYSRGEMRVVASAYAGYPVYYLPGNLAEQNPEDWWSAFEESLGKLLETGCFTRRDIAAISVSAHTPTLFPIDEDGEPLMRGAIWADARSAKESEEIRRKFGSKIKCTNPVFIRPYHMIGKIEWLRINRPEIFAVTSCFLQCNSYVNYRLTGQCFIDHCMAGNYHYYDIYGRCWNADLCRALGVTPETLPSLAESYEVIGNVRPSVCNKVCLDEETLVVAGACDTAAATLGAGVFEEGGTFYSTGTGSSIAQLVKIPPSNMNIDDTFLIMVPRL